MDVTQIIAANLDDWMANHPDLNTLKKVSARASIGFGTVRRARNGDGNTTIQNLAAIAKAFGRPLEDLLAAPGSQVGGDVIELPRPPDLPSPIKELVEVAQSMTRDGQLVLLGRAQEISLHHRQVRKNRRN